MDLEIIILSEVSRKEKDKYHMISLIFRIIKKDINEYIPNQRLTDIENKFMVTKGEKGSGDEE